LSEKSHTQAELMASGSHARI